MRRTLSLLVLLTLAAACEPAPDPGDASGVPGNRSDGPAVVAATLPPIASLVRFLGGDAVDVRTLLPPGAHPDSYETTPRVARSLATADLVVRVGGAADAWLGTVADTRTVVLTDDMALHDQDGPGTGNPHVWLDPIRVRDGLVPRIGAALAEIAPEHRPELDDRARALADSLTALDAEIRALLADVPARRFVAAHPAWVYFAERYGLEQVGAVHESPGTEIASRDLARLVEEIRGQGVRAVIAEPQLGRAGVDALADELGVRVEVADAIGGPGLEGREDYMALMRFNARAFARALGGAE